MTYTVILPPLVYGPGVKANFRSMMKWLSRGVPLPLGAIDNRRSLVGLENLVDLIMRVIQHPRASNQVFLAGDGEDLSTPALLTCLGSALGHKATLLPVPTAWLRGLAGCLGKASVARRLCASLQVDIDKTCRRLDWTPPMTTEQGLRQTAAAFLEERTRA